MNNEDKPIAAGAEGAAEQDGQQGAPAGASATEPSSADIQKMYDDLGIKASVPTGKAVGRPKSTEVRTKDGDEGKDKDSKPGREKEADGSGGKSKDASDSDKNGGTGDGADAKGKKVGEDSGKVFDKSDKAGEGVRKDESKTGDDSKRKGEGSSEEGDSGAGQAADKSGDSQEEGKDGEGKRPGKSNPETEKRFQKLTGDIKQRDQVIADLQKQLAEKDAAVNQAKIDKDDPVYTVDDFRKVRDEQGNVLDLDQDQAELAYRRWKDGYDQRRSEREAKLNHEASVKQAQQEANEKLMRSSVAAYDILTEIYDTTPQLNSKSPEFDQEFSDLVMPIIEDAVIYQKGTEPGNEKGLRPVIVGLKMNPSKILAAMNTLKQAKRSLPLNGVTDTVESGSNVSVSHGRSSDPLVQAANELYKELKIDKRF